MPLHRQTSREKSKQAAPFGEYLPLSKSRLGMNTPTQIRKLINIFLHQQSSSWIDGTPEFQLKKAPHLLASKETRESFSAALDKPVALTASPFRMKKHQGLMPNLFLPATTIPSLVKPKKWRLIKKSIKLSQNLRNGSRATSTSKRTQPSLKSFSTRTSTRSRLARSKAA